MQENAFVGGMIYGLLTYSDNDQKTLEFALAASALKNTIYGDFNQVTVEESGRINARKHFRKSSQITIFMIIAKQN